MMGLQRFAIATTVATFLLLLVGGTVNPTGSSLACPDWPTCHGSFFPAMKDGVEYEHTHRLVATAVGLMTLALAVWIWRARRAEPRLVLLGWAALGLVIVQGVLGGVTVLLELPLWISVAHLALSMAFFLLLIYLSYRLGTAAGEAARPGAVATSRAGRGWLWLATGAIFVQILLGALVRHTGSGRACGADWLLCAGQLWPPGHPAQMHMLHRLAGLVVLGLVVAAALVGARLADRAGRGLARGLSLSGPLLALLQIVVGALLVRSSIGLWQAVAHTGLAALLLGATALAAFALGPARSPLPRRPQQAAGPAGALGAGRAG